MWKKLVRGAPFFLHFAVPPFLSKLLYDFAGVQFPEGLPRTPFLLAAAVLFGFLLFAKGYAAFGSIPTPFGYSSLTSVYS